MSGPGAICCFESGPSLCCFESAPSLCCFESGPSLCCFDAENNYNMNMMVKNSAGWCGKPLECSSPCMGECNKRSDTRKPIQVDWMNTAACMMGDQCVANYKLKTVTHEIFQADGSPLLGDPEELVIALEADGVTPMEYVECGQYQSQVFLEAGASCTQYLVVATATFTDCGREWTEKRCFKVFIEDSF